VVSAIAAGLTNRDIATQLSVAEDTVKHHLSNVFDKVGVSNRLELALFAIEHGLVERSGAPQTKQPLRDVPDPARS
jgi:DNA-binding NarL/FixJ family response regulator